MALFDFFRKFKFFAGRDTNGLEDRDLDFDAWIAVHRDWRQRLARFIDGQSKEALDEKVVCQDDRCELGKWIYAHGSQFYGDLDEFRALRARHAVFHHHAGAVIACSKSEGREAARRLLNRDFDQSSLQVVQELQALERRVKG